MYSVWLSLVVLHNVVVHVVMCLAQPYPPRPSDEGPPRLSCRDPLAWSQGRPPITVITVERIFSGNTIGTIYIYIYIICIYRTCFYSFLPCIHSRPRIGLDSEMEPNWVVFETSCYAFGGRIHRFASKRE